MHRNMNINYVYLLSVYVCTIVVGLPTATATGALALIWQTIDNDILKWGAFLRYIWQTFQYHTLGFNGRNLRKNIIYKL